MRSLLGKKTKWEGNQSRPVNFTFEFDRNRPTYYHQLCSDMFSITYPSLSIWGTWWDSRCLRTRSRSKKFSCNTKDLESTRMMAALSGGVPARGQGVRVHAKRERNANGPQTCWANWRQCSPQSWKDLQKISRWFILLLSKSNMKVFFFPLWSKIIRQTHPGKCSLFSLPMSASTSTTLRWSKSLGISSSTDDIMEPLRSNSTLWWTTFLSSMAAQMEW